MLLPYAEQLERKREVLVRALGAYPLILAAPIGATAPAEPTRDFRLRAKLVAAGGALGLFARGTHDVIDIPECQVLRPRLHAVAQSLRRDLARMPGVSSFDLREADAGVLVTAAVTGRLADGERRALAEHIAALDANVVSVAVSTREPDAPQLLGAEAETLVGPAELEHRPDPSAPWHYAAHGAFSQAHPGQLARLHAALETELAQGGARPLAGLRVLELYAGSGLLSLRLAARGARPLLVESFAPAARMAERAAHAQGLSIRVLAADAGAALAKLVRAGERFEAVLVNPPRRGLAPDVREAIARLRPALLLYVSCEPATLARDASHLALLGLGLERATPYDMIPLSDAVEALARFVPATPPPPRVLFEDERFLFVEKAPHEAVLPGPGSASSLLARVRRLPGAAEAVTRDALEPGSSGLVAFARRPDTLDELLRALERGALEWLVLSRGVLRARGNLASKAGSGSPARYERREVSSGHSLIAVRTTPTSALDVTRALARLRHPVPGDERHGDRRANLHFSHRHQLERPFVHRRALELELPGVPPRIECELAPDLARVLESLRARDPRQLPKR
jgi:23S rRNA (uracil1939-C5)-methyltransferase